MKGNTRRFKAKEKRFLQLYSLWQETKREDVRSRCLGLLEQIMAVHPAFSLRHEFQRAF